MHFCKEIIFLLKKIVFTLQNNNNLMHVLRNDFLMDKTVFKKHIFAFINMIANLNDYIIQIQTSSLDIEDANA